MEAKKAAGSKPAKRKASQGSFWIGRVALDLLVQQANAAQICTYLVLAKYTDRSGMLSTAGLTAVKKAFGIGDEQAKRALDALAAMRMDVKVGEQDIEQRLVYSAEEWCEMTGEIFERPTVQSQVRWVLPQFGCDETDAAWFGNGLVDGYGQFQQPLKRLKRAGDVAARLLLKLYQYNDMEQFGGVQTKAVFGKFNMELVLGRDGINLWHAKSAGNEVWHSFALPVLRLVDLPKKKESSEIFEPFWSAIQALEVAGLIYPVVMVLDSAVSDQDANVMYELHSKNRFGYKPKGEEGLGTLTAKLAGYLHRPVTDGAGRFSGTYAVVAEAGVKPQAVGIFRLRFRLTNTKNRGVSSAYQRIQAGQDEWREVIEGMLNEYEPEDEQRRAVGFE